MGGWWDWLYGWLAHLGLFQKTASLVILGLDNSGKSTLLHKLKTGSIRLHPPTERPSVEEIVVGNVQLAAVDCGGHQAVRHLWDEYLDDVSAIIFVVDSGDHERMEEARDELESILSTDTLSNVPLLILGNKQDLNGSLTRSELVDELGVAAVMAYEDGAREREVEVFAISLISEEDGLSDSLAWLCARV